MVSTVQFLKSERCNEMQTTKKQHYIPQGLIKHFSSGDRRTFELYNNNFLSEKAIKNTMCHNLVYEHDKIPINSLEHFFSKIESSFIPLHDKLVIQIKKNYEEKSIIPEDSINELLLFYVLLYLRSGALLEEYSAYSDDPKNQRVERLLENLLVSSYPAKLTNTISQGYQISVIASKEDFFLMSDQFISTASLKFKNTFSNRSNRQIGFKDTILFIPISSKFYIVFYHGNKPDYIIPKKISTLTTTQVTEINSIIAKNSYKKTIASREKPLKNIKKDIESTTGPRRNLLFYNDDTVSIFTTKKEIEFYNSERLFAQNYMTLFAEYKNNYENKIKRNDICFCGSKKKYKKCCLLIHQRLLEIARRIWNQEKDWYSISSNLIVENAIEVYRGPKKDIPDSMDKKILKQLSKNKLK